MKVTVIPGDGIGPELMEAATEVVDAAGASIVWKRIPVQSTPNTLAPEAVTSLKQTGVGLAGFFSVPLGPGSARSANVQLYQALDLYANVVHSFEVPGPHTRHKDVDIVVIRENTEGEYSGMEHEVAPGITETIKVTTREKTRRIAEYAFEYAYLNDRRKVTAVHKANVMKKSDGLFLESCREQARLYPTVEFEEIIVDYCMNKLVRDPQRFDVMVTPNLYGSMIANGVAGLTAGVGVCGGANLGPHASVFEQGARHVGLDIAGKNRVNPTGILLASSMMLRHIRQPSAANRLDLALYNVLQQPDRRTADQGGKASASDFVKYVIEELHKLQFGGLPKIKAA